MEVAKGYKQSEVGVIPEDWEVYELGGIISSVQLGGNYPNAEKETMNPLIKMGNLGRGNIVLEKQEFIIEAIKPSERDKLCFGNVLFNTRNTLDLVGKIAIWRNELPIAYFNSNILRLNFDLHLVSSNEFLNYILNTKLILNQLRGIATGTTSVAAIYTRDLVKIKLPLPTPAEQTAIATALSDVDALIQSLEKLIAKKRAIKQGTMQELLKPREDWVLKKLGDVATLKARIGWQGLTTAEYKDTGDYFLITGTEFKNGFIDWENCFYVEQNRYKQDRNIQVKENDVLVTKDGTIGKVAFIKEVLKPATLNSGIFTIRPVNQTFHPAFFYYLLLSETFRKFLSQLSAGSTINHLYQKDFIHFEFQTPANVEEQSRIATILADMDVEIEDLETKLAKYKQIKQGMMQNLLTGRIRLV